jgi:hypothetical protein
LAVVGLTDVSVTSTHLVTDGMHSAIIKASKPMLAEPAVALSATPRELPLATTGCCGADGACC